MLHFGHKLVECVDLMGPQGQAASSAVGAAGSGAAESNSATYRYELSFRHSGPGATASSAAEGTEAGMTTATTTVVAKWLIGADGGFSRVRRTVRKGAMNGLLFMWVGLEVAAVRGRETPSLSRATRSRSVSAPCSRRPAACRPANGHVPLVHCQGLAAVWPPCFCRVALPPLQVGDGRAPAFLGTFSWWGSATESQLAAAGADWPLPLRGPPQPLTRNATYMPPANRLSTTGSRNLLTFRNPPCDLRATRDGGEVSIVLPGAGWRCTRTCVLPLWHACKGRVGPVFTCVGTKCCTQVQGCREDVALWYMEAQAEAMEAEGVDASPEGVYSVPV